MDALLCAATYFRFAFTDGALRHIHSATIDTCNFSMIVQAGRHWRIQGTSKAMPLKDPKWPVALPPKKLVGGVFLPLGGFFTAMSVVRSQRRDQKDDFFFAFF